MVQQQVLSIIIPVFNEEKTIVEIYKKVKAVNLDKQIIIIDDCSTDATSTLLKRLSDPDILLLQHTHNQGKGTAIRTGLTHARGEITIIQDADLEYDPQDYHVLIQPILEKKARVVYGSRRLNKNNKQYVGFVYYIGGISLTAITNFLYNASLTDEATCYKVFETTLLKELNLECQHFEFCPEVTAKLLRKKIPILEVPIHYYPRSTEQGKKIRIRDGFEAVWTLLKWKWKNI